MDNETPTEEDFNTEFGANYVKACVECVENGKASTSFIQRTCQVSYNLAAKIMAKMEADGLVTPANAVGKREITEKLKKSIEILSKITLISVKTGVSAEKVYEAAENEMEKRRTVPGPGHNSGEAEGVDKATQARLKSIIDRVERLEEEKSGLAEDIKEIFGEAKAGGFDVKIIRQIIRLRKVDLDKRREAEMLLETYKCAIGME